MTVSITRFFAIIEEHVKPRVFLLISILMLALPASPLEVNKIQTKNVSILFESHCAGCHLNGENIIRRSKSLFKSDLSKQEIFDSKAIASIAKAGIGQMSGYYEVITPQEADQISEWIYLQALNDWS